MYESGLKNTSLYKSFEKSSDYDLLVVLKASPKKSRNFEIIMAVLWDRYLPQVHKNWWELQRQMNNLTAVNLKKTDYYSDAMEAFTIAIDKIDLDRVENDKFKCVGMINWYLTNVRTKIIKQIKKAPQQKSLDMMNRSGNEDSMTIDSDVEQAYHESEGYRLEPEYQMDLAESDRQTRVAINRCKSRWCWEESFIFDRFYEGKKRTEIAREVGIPVEKVSNMLTKIKNDLRKELKDVYPA